MGGWEGRGRGFGVAFLRIEISGCVRSSAKGGQSTAQFDSCRGCEEWD